MKPLMIHEHERFTPISEDCDVAVVGGGIAGIAASLSAAREGAKTILLEQQYVLGGLATAGLVTIFLPLCDGSGRQVTFGIAEEILQLSAAKEGKDIVGDWKSGLKKGIQDRLTYTYNPNLMALETERLLLEAGVQIIYGANICDTVVENRMIRALLMETRSGRSAVSVRNVVDASGDAVVSRLSGECTEIYHSNNILAAWYYTVQEGRYQLNPLGAYDDPAALPAEDANQEYQPLYSGLDYRELSRFTVDAHRALLSDYLRGGDPSESYQLGSIATIPQLRMTRRLSGKCDLDEPESYTRYEDSIGMIGNWKKRGPCYEIPFSCLYGEKIANLLTAGRCISVTDTMWDNTRVIPACAVTGEAAGLAATMCEEISLVDVSKLQNRLRQRNIPLHPEHLPDSV